VAQLAPRSLPEPPRETRFAGLEPFTMAV